MLEYKIESDYIDFWCWNPDENEPAASILTKFLLELSLEKKVFVQAYRLWDRDAEKLMDPVTILGKAEMLVNPFYTYFYLSEAKIKFQYFESACEVSIYYFDKEVEWFDFLATSEIQDPIIYIKTGILSAVLISGDHGSDYRLKCSRAYEKRIIQLVQDLLNTGYQMKPTSRKYYLKDK